MHPPLTTFGDVPFSDNFPGPQLQNSCAHLDINSWTCLCAIVPSRKNSPAVCVIIPGISKPIACQTKPMVCMQVVAFLRKRPKSRKRLKRRRQLKQPKTRIQKNKHFAEIFRKRLFLQEKCSSLQTHNNKNNNNHMSSGGGNLLPKCIPIPFFRRVSHFWCFRTLSCPLMASNYANLYLVLISFRC